MEVGMITWMTWYWAALLSIPFGTLLGVIFALIPFFCWGLDHYGLGSSEYEPPMALYDWVWVIISVLLFLSGFPLAYFLLMGKLN